jgi:hypothetical protein
MRLSALAPILLALASPLAPNAQQPAVPARSGGTLIILDSMDLHGAGGQTLAAFLAGRVPGVTIGYTTGLESATPSVISRGTYGTFAAPEPLLYVDGVLWKDDWHNTGSVHDIFGSTPFYRGLNPPSVGWGLPVEEIAQVRVHLGASSAMMLEDGASRGAVYVTTHRPGAGAPEVRASLWMAAKPGGALGAPSVGTYGIVDGSLSYQCTLALEADGDCVFPVESVSWHPADQLLPYQPARGTNAALSATGSLRGWAFRASAIRGLMEGSLPGGHSDRTDLGLATTGRVGSTIDLSFDARYALSRGWRTEWDGSNLVGGYLSWVGPNPLDTMRADVLEQVARLNLVSPRRESDRISVGARAGWRLSPATTLEFTASQDLLRRVSHADWPEIGFVTNEPVTTTRQSSLYQRDASISAMASHVRPVLRGWRLDSRAGLRYRRTATDEKFSHLSCCISDPFIGPSYGASAWLAPGVEVTTLLASSRLEIGERGMIGAGLRQEARFGERTSPTMKSAEGSWDLVARGDMRLVARAGYGESIDNRIPFQRIGSFGSSARTENAIDREVALDARLGGRVETSIAYSVTTVTHGTLWGLPALGPFPSTPTTPSASWRVDGTLLRAGLRSRVDAITPWRLSLSALSRRPLLQGMSAPAFCGGTNWTLVVTCTEVGHPLGRPIIASHTYNDANDDGIITASEVTVATAIAFADIADPSWVVSLTGDVAVTSWIRLGTVIESHLGQTVIDLPEVTRCRRDLCAALHDPSTPLAEQAAAIAVGVGGQYDLSGFARDASFVRIRDVHVALTPRILRGSTLRFAAHQLLAWTRFPNGDPEAMPRIGAVATGEGGYHEGIRPTFTVRLELAPLRR